MFEDVASRVVSTTEEAVPEQCRVCRVNFERSRELTFGLMTRFAVDEELVHYYGFTTWIVKGGNRVICRTCRFPQYSSIT
jgi:hypothetical protein